MYRSYVLMQYIDEIRKSRKIKVVDFNEGITTPRTYSRYLNGEFDMPVDVFLKYLDHLNVTMRDFFLYIYNSIHFNNLSHLDFVRAVREGKVKEANELLKTINIEEKSEVYDILLPVSILKLNHMQNRILKSQLLDGIDKILNVDSLLKSNVISRQEFKSLLIYREYCKQEQKIRIDRYLEEILNGRIEIISLEFHKEKISIYNLLISDIVRYDVLDEPTKKKLKRLFNEILDNIEKLCLGEKLPDVVENLRIYHEKTGDEEKHRLAIFYLVSLQLAKNVEFTDIPTEYFEIYMDILNSRDPFESSFYDTMRFAL